MKQQQQIEDIPVYLFVGFLESGKTKFIQETMEDKRFNNGEKTLLLVCEEGIEEFDLSRFPNDNTTLHVIDSKEDFTEDNLARILEECGATRVVLEYNGMWSIEHLFEQMPLAWAVYQGMCFLDSTHFLDYNTNMRGLVVDKINVSELVVFNRFDLEYMDQTEFHKIVRSVSRRTQIVYETTDGQTAYDDIEDPLPFDIEAENIVVDDRDFALFLRDIMEEPKKYKGKTVTFKGMSIADKQFTAGTFAFGRQVMTCCVDDIQFCWLLARWNQAQTLDNHQWSIIKAKVSLGRHKLYRGEGAVLDVLEVTPSQAPEQEVATFF